MSDDTPRTVASFNLLDVEAEISESTNRLQELHDHLVTAAETKARSLLEKAIAERDQTVESARQEGHAQGLEEGRKEGRVLGEQHLVEEQRESVKSVAEKLSETLNRTNDLVEREAILMADQSRRDLLKLALAVAETACAVTVQDPGTTSQQLVADLISRLSTRRTLVVEVHPEVMEAMTNYAEELRTRFEDIERIQLRGDEGLELGAVRVSNEITQMEMSISDALERLHKEWGL